MNMWNKIFAVAISTNLVFAPLAIAEDETPKYTHLEQGAEAPFSGTLFNPAATARLIADSQFNMSDCDLRVEFKIEQTKAEYQLKLNMLQASYDSLDERHKLLMDIKAQEIETYREMALDQPNKHSEWWLAGGVVAGITLTLGVLFASQEIQK